MAQFHDPLVYLLLGAVAVALVAWAVEGRHGWPVDAIVVAIVVGLDAALGFVQEAKAENAVAALARMTAVGQRRALVQRAAQGCGPRLDCAARPLEAVAQERFIA